MILETIDVLLIEDNWSDAELTVHAFQKYTPVKRIHVVHHGADTLEFFHCTGAYASRNEAAHPRLILLDLKLPLVDGQYVLRQIRTSPTARDVPVIVLTSSREPQDIYQCWRRGISGYIVKPVDFDEFIDVARTIAKYWLELNNPQVDS